MINAQVVADSLSPQGDRLTSLLITFPRFILAEVNTHRMLSKNTSSSRAIPFNKMVEAVQENPFIPIAWQKSHSGMQGSEYLDERGIEVGTSTWLVARNKAVEQAKHLVTRDVTKQLANRLLEPFMWTTMLITGPQSGWDNFFELRCPQYYFEPEERSFKSRREWMRHYEGCFGSLDSIGEKDDFWWLQINQGQAEIHMMALAECIYNAMNESKPVQLKAGEWHIPFINNLDFELLAENYGVEAATEMCIKISTAMAARTSYTVVGDEKELDYKKMIDLHDRLLSQNPPHSSPMEHCAQAMTEFEHYNYTKRTLAPGQDFGRGIEHTGWCRNYRGFIPYRHIVESIDKS